MKKMIEFLSNYAYEIVAIGVFFTLLGSLTGGVGAYLAQKKSSLNQKVLMDKNQEIASLNKQISEFITGGTSFCYVVIPATNTDNNKVPYKAPMVIILEGKLPVYDVYVRINDNDNSDLSFERIVNNRVSVGTVTPGEPIILPYYFNFLPNEVKKNFNMFISTRNGFYIQSIKLLKINGKWESATRVMKRDESGERNIFENKTQDFPPITEKEWRK